MVAGEGGVYFSVTDGRDFYRHVLLPVLLYLGRWNVSLSVYHNV